jgi:hypothetical protein
VAHRDRRHVRREARGIDPALDVVRRPIGAVHHEAGALDDLAHLALALKAPRHRYQATGRVEGRERLRGDLRLEPADVALPVEDLAVEVALLDPVAVHQHELTHAAAGQRVGGPAA